MSVLARIFLVLLIVALPPLLLLSLLFAFGDGLVQRLGQGTTLLVVALAAVGWAAVVSLITSRSFGRDLESLIQLAERGPSDDPASSAAERRLALALDERNHQLGELAAYVREAPITENAAVVARRVVAAVRSVTANPTWSFAVLGTSAPEDLKPGVYEADEHDAVEPIGELHRWASVADEENTSGVRYSDGPWGAFVIVDIGEEDLVHGVLIAPWQGRPEPSAAERELLLLIAQHAALALEHALLYARVRRQAEELDRMADIQRDFLRGITHDLQTPLTSIRAVASELRAAPDLADSAVDDLAVIEQQADRLRRMVAQLLAMSRLEAGALEPRIDVVRVEPLVRRTWTALHSDREFQLRSEGVAHLAIADADRLEQVLWALLDNALKYSHGNSPIEVRIAGLPTDSGQLASVIDVRDHGVGMDRLTRGRAFEQFYRSEVARQMVPDGSGIGLYAAAGLMRAMGGSIGVEEPADGGGTLLRLTLPAEAIHEPIEAGTH